MRHHIRAMMTIKFLQLFFIFWSTQDVQGGFCGGWPYTCSPGFYWSSYSEECEPCWKRYYNVDGRDCRECPRGMISTLNRTACERCPDGTYLNWKQCKPCQLGSISTNGLQCDECPEGTFSVNGTTCQECPLGTYSGKGWSQCEKCFWETENENRTKNISCNCPKGTYRLNATTCEKCPLGYYADSEGLTCKRCSRSKISTENRTSCKYCPPGTWNVWKTKYTKCEKIRYGLIAINGTLQSCPEGTISNKNRTKCEKCPLGTYSKKGWSFCLKCFWNTTTTNKTEEGISCDCPKGTYRLDEKTCKTCHFRYYSDREGLMKCKECPYLSFATQNRTGCEYCPPGFQYYWWGCEPCVEGTISTERGYSCKDCPQGTFSVNGTKCEKCPFGYFHKKRKKIPSM